MDASRKTEIRRLLYTDPAWGAYALADLQDAVYDSTEWYLEAGRTAAVDDDGLVMLYNALQPTVLFSIGSDDAVARAMARMVEHRQPPASVYLTIRPEHEAVIGRYYDNSSDRREMLRMVFRRPDVLVLPTPRGMTRLLPDDAPRVQALIATGGDFAPDAFDPWQMTNGVFYGMEDGRGELIAVGGTHIVDWDGGVGTVGNFYTRPDARKHGLGTLILNAVVGDLRAGGVDLIVLNVDQRNALAAHLYEHNGFKVHCPYIEGVAHLKR